MLEASAPSSEDIQSVQERDDAISEEQGNLTPEEQKEAIRQVAQEMRHIVKEHLTSAQTEEDYLRWSTASLYATTEDMIGWIWEYGGTTAAELTADYQSAERDEIVRKEGQYLRALAQKLSEHASRDGFVKLALKRIRDKSGRYESYRVLAEFPSGFYVKPTRWEAPDQRDSSNPHVIYFEPSQACTIHACDDLYRQRGDVVFVQAVDYMTAFGRLNGNEYMLEKTDEGKVSQDPSNYVLFALIGGFSNENNRVRISDFWNKHEKKNDASV